MAVSRPACRTCGTGCALHTKNEDQATNRVHNNTHKLQVAVFTTTIYTPHSSPHRSRGSTRVPATRTVCLPPAHHADDLATMAR